MTHTSTAKLPKSLGTLSPHKKTAPRSPDYLGKVSIQKPLLKLFVQQFLANNAPDELIVSIAAWQQHKDNNPRNRPFFTIEIGPHFETKPAANPEPAVKSQPSPLTPFFKPKRKDIL